MTAWAIRLVTVPDTTGYDCNIRNPWEGWWLAAYDPDGHEGLGRAEFAPTADTALRFGSFDEARACWYQQSSVMPTKRDGDREWENRPLAVASISIDEV